MRTSSYCLPGWESYFLALSHTYIKIETNCGSNTHHPQIYCSLLPSTSHRLKVNCDFFFFSKLIAQIVFCVFFLNAKFKMTHTKKCIFDRVIKQHHHIKNKKQNIFD